MYQKYDLEEEKEISQPAIEFLVSSSTTRKINIAGTPNKYISQSLGMQLIDMEKIPVYLSCVAIDISDENLLILKDKNLEYCYVLNYNELYKNQVRRFIINSREWGWLGWKILDFSQDLTVLLLRNLDYGFE